MKKNFKLMLVALFALMGGSAMAAPLEGTTQYAGGGLQYHIKSLDKTAGTYTVSVSQADWAIQAVDKTALTIPTTVAFPLKGEDHNGDAVDESITFKVVEIEANGFKDLSDIETITFAVGEDGKSNITEIGAGAFAGTSISELNLTKTKITTLNKLFEYNNVYLKKVILPETLTALAVEALADCIQLKTVDFKACTKLTTLGQYSLSNTIVNTYDFSTCAKLNLNAAGLTPFVNLTTTTNKNLNTVILPAAPEATAMTGIGIVFADCENLTTITNLDKSNITEVVDLAFANDKKLEALSFPVTLKTIASSAAGKAPFRGCASLTALNIPYDALTTIGGATAPLFEEATAGDGSLAALKTLNFFTNNKSTKSFAATINANAFSNCTGITTVKIAEGDDIAASAVLSAAAIALANAMDDENPITVVLGELNMVPTAAFIAGPTATGVAATVTIGEVKADQDQAAAIVSGNIGTFTVGKLSKKLSIAAIGSAAKIVFSGEIADALTAPTVANSRLTEIDFGTNKIKDVAGVIPEKAFSEDVAPNLTKVTWNPAAAPTNKVFDIMAFGTSAKDDAAKVEFTTITAVAALYPAGAGGAGNELDKNLYNVIFIAAPEVDEGLPITVRGTSTSTYFYGYFKCPGTSRYAIAKDVEDDPETTDVDESAEQVVVYSAFIDEADNTLYMDPLAIKDGNYIVAKNQVVIVRVKNPATKTALTKPAGGFTYGLKAFATDMSSTMRITPYDGYAVVNALKQNPILYSSDYIGTNFVGKTIYAMADPAKYGKMEFMPLTLDQYLPANSVFVVKNEATSAPMTVVWLDGNEATGIINKMAEKTQDGEIYNLQGIRVNGAQKGVYIKNGKKFIK